MLERIDYDDEQEHEHEIDGFSEALRVSSCFGARPAA